MAGPERRFVRPNVRTGEAPADRPADPDRLQGGFGAPTARSGPLYFDDHEDHPAWLEVEDEDHGSRLDGRRIIGVLLAGILLVGMAGLAVYWMRNMQAEPELIPDGSLIAAPDQPYKTRPAPGSSGEVEGTGGVSFAVAEGMDRESRIAAAPPIAGEIPAGEAAAGASRVQIGAFASHEEASANWVRLRDRSLALQGRRHVIVEAPGEGGHVFRLQALAAGPEDAEALCAAYQAEGGDCAIRH